jgi:hypothetical protein
MWNYALKIYVHAYDKLPSFNEIIIEPLIVNPEEARCLYNVLSGTLCSRNINVKLKSPL